MSLFFSLGFSSIASPFPFSFIEFFTFTLFGQLLECLDDGVPSVSIRSCSYSKVYIISLTKLIGGNG
ncbi:hypothetical protein ES319_A12G184300v1 [Gossypium barbadense]|uniref:Uncharacterized protein n=2 Tax=Gossypium TaxID=3633 RepID=A0A5J5TCW6_GOSBA|nr:hypothetical protein ES319_A12G184300v1 [Gossypium barbadense]TYG90672.1 hypothetical protein ES288_A12G200800v1 [Gossypium darwinii]